MKRVTRWLWLSFVCLAAGSAARADEAAQRVADVLREIVEPAPAPGVNAVLAQRCGVAEAQARRGMRGAGREPVRFEAPLSHLDVQAHLFVQLARQTLAPDERRQPPHELLRTHPA